MIIAVNKWDALEKDDKTIYRFTEKVRNTLAYMPYAELLFISAKTGQRLPKAPRSFKVPLEPVLPIVGIAGTVFMICNISTDPTERNAILLLSGAVFLALGVYSFFWIRFKMKMPVFKSVPVEKVMAMEHDMYDTIRKRRGIWR